MQVFQYNYHRPKTVKMKFTLAIITVLLSMKLFQVQAQDGETIRTLTQESMVNNSDGVQIELAWLLADPFWEYLINVNPETANTETGEEFYRIVSEYTIIVVVMAQSRGNITFTSEEEMRKGMSLKGQDGKNYEPLKSSDVSAELNMILGIFRPIFGQFLGEMGANMQFFVFEKENKKGGVIFDPAAEQDVTLEVQGTSLTWDLPMSSLISEKRCPEDDELMNGTWNYCPIHGDKLEEVED
jgi:hypothetical protein